jgi:hypothetical protein
MGLRGAFVIVMLAALPAIARESGSVEAAAAWKRHEVDFLYSGFTTRYSCGGLRSKVKLLLKHLGARPDIKITERGCDEGRSLVAQFPRLKVAFYAPELPASGARDVASPCSASGRRSQSSAIRRAGSTWAIANSSSCSAIASCRNS